MKHVLRKTGSVLFCLLPFLLAFALNLIVSVVAVVFKIITIILTDPSIINDFDTYYSRVQEMLMDGPFLAGISAIYAVLAAAIMGFWYWMRFVRKKISRRTVSQIIHPQMFLGLLLLMIGMQYISTYIVNLTAVINPGWLETYETLMENIGFGDLSLILVIYSVIIAPVSEELIFRGVTMSYARRIMPFWLANIFQAFLFGVFHGNVVQGAYAFVVGLFCGYVCHRSGSIYLSILFHFLFNLWGTFMSANALYSGGSILLHILIFIISAGIALLGFYVYNQGCSRRRPIILQEKAEQPSEAQ